MLRLIFSLLSLLLATAAFAQATQPAPSRLPPDIEAAIARARLPREALGIWIADAQGRDAPRLSFQAALAMTPASVMKLVTSYAALDLLGPAFTWNTAVFADGRVQDGTLQGNLVLRGSGDPKLVLERLWLLLRRVQGLGIRSISGDIVLDHSAFQVPDTDPASFDGEALRPYNAAPDALLLNYKSLLISLVPNRVAGVASVSVEPPLAGLRVPSSVPLLGGDCGDYRAALKADFSDPLRVTLAGGFPASCGEKLWPVAYSDPSHYAARMVEGMWKEMGGRLSGTVRDGLTPAGLRPLFEQASPPLTDVIRDMNKFSNNVMAQQLFLTLSQQNGGVGSFDASRALVRDWWKARWPQLEAPVLENGSGLSRQARITPLALGRMLQSAYQSPIMPELLSSLPIAGVDGTLRRSQASRGTAHMKTGSLRDVTAIAGYVLGASGRRYVLVAIANHSSQAGAARPVFDALMDWAAKDE